MDDQRIRARLSLKGPPSPGVAAGIAGVASHQFRKRTKSDISAKRYSITLVKSSFDLPHIEEWTACAWFVMKAHSPRRPAGRERPDSHWSRFDATHKVNRTGNFFLQ